MDQSTLVLIGVVVLGLAFLGMVVLPLVDRWLDDLEEGDDNWTDKW